MAEKKHAEEGEKKSSKKLIIIIVAVVLLLIGGAAGGYFFMTQQSAKTDEHGDKAAAEEHKASEHEAAAEEEHAPEPEIYYELPGAFIVNFPPGGTIKIAKISVTLLLKGEDTVAALKKHEPMVRNNLLMVISSLGAERIRVRDGKEQLRGLMLAEIGKVMQTMAGKNKIQDLYFTDFVMQ